jgi:hypothetical protein
MTKARTDAALDAALQASYAQADELKRLVAARTGLAPDKLRCPRERSDMTPCVARDGRLAVCEGRYGSSRGLCVGCEHGVATLLIAERAKTQN